IKLRRTANARERDRTYNVNNAFHHLRSIIPTEPADRKLSKIETIRLATSYIAHLHTVINTDLHLHQQPCLMSGACEGVDDGGDNGPTIICTFCLSASKAHSNGVTF
ncbi:hypothetical protein HELRODRAFT_91618, partial [Helobdella robusta]|uniref:BHLH domain-containing protein n=1 Tax=Helobdella robusta TaxID=6412 RepID=T1G863_HELRO